MTDKHDHIDPVDPLAAVTGTTDAVGDDDEPSGGPALRRSFKRMRMRRSFKRMRMRRSFKRMRARRSFKRFRG